jgi:glycosyltransferase involved in cell wall biosynthesis
MLPQTICIITPNNFYQLAGSEKINLFLLQELRRKFSHVSLVGTKLIRDYFSAKQYFFPAGEYRETGKSFMGINLLKRVLKRIHSKQKIDIVISIGLVTTNPALYKFIKDDLRIPLIVHPIGGDYQLRSGTDYGIIPGSKNYRNARYIMGLADAIVVPGLFMIDEIGRDYSIPREKFSLILNPVDISFYANNVSFSYPERYFIYVGRLIEKKGVDILIRAFTCAVQEGLRSSLFIVGKGNEESGLKELAAHGGVTDKVIFCGEQTGIIKLGLLKGAVAFVAPSRREPYGNTIIEAISAGLPVIASGNEGHLDIPVLEYGGQFFKNEQELKNILLTFDSPAPSETVTEVKFPWDAQGVAREWVGLINRLYTIQG